MLEQIGVVLNYLMVAILAGVARLEGKSEDVAPLDLVLPSEQMTF